MSIIDLDQAIENYLRDKDHDSRIRCGLTPWPTSHEQQLIDAFNIYQAEQENEQW